MKQWQKPRILTIGLERTKDEGVATNDITLEGLIDVPTTLEEVTTIDQPTTMEIPTTLEEITTMDNQVMPIS